VGNLLGLDSAEIAITLGLLDHISHKCKLVGFHLLFMLNQIKIQTLDILIHFDIAFLRVLLKVAFNTNLPNRFDDHLTDPHKVGFSVLVNDELCPDLLNYALVVLLNELD
jgi:hypothetical protein